MEQSDKLKPNTQALIVYKNSNSIYLYGEKAQLEQLNKTIDSQPFDIICSLTSYNSWGPYLEFKSIASVYTLLLRNGFRLSHESKAHIANESNYFIEVWIRD